ncbi:hypothetical protein IKE_05946 [Bacillus cereus VD196]|uniref:Uncharacterized protein n=1 Tax=Bacillus cereus VD196 TaxID=1053243 RepID=A0A9W5PYA2_BACCE|nr:hypothetical protein [Bacillus cereus]EJR89814.1 hypothetical protein IKG_05958 [Bacillus cereus VD200]EOO60746.1 hypothetical protein IKE_05946 [Bacillus cereus VD196]
MNEKSKVNMVQGLTLGLVAGVVVFMSKKENRKKVQSIAEKAKGKIIETSEDMKIKEKIDVVKDKGKQLVNSNAVQKKISEIQKSTFTIVEKAQGIFNNKKINSEKNVEMVETKMGPFEKEKLGSGAN